MGQQGFSLSAKWFNILLVIVMLMIMATPYVDGGIPLTTEIKAIVSKIRPWFAPISSILLFRAQIRKWGEKSRGWQTLPLYAGAFGITIVLLAVVGVDNPFYVDFYRAVVLNTGDIVLATQAVTYAAAYMMLTPRNIMAVEIMIFTILGVLGSTPILYAISPQLLTIVEFMVAQNIASVEVVYTSYLNSVIGLMSMFIVASNVLTLRDNLKPR